METKDRIFWCLIGMFIFSLFLNAALIKYKIEINFIENGGHKVSEPRDLESAEKSESIFSKIVRSAGGGGKYEYDFEDGRTQGWKQGKVTTKIVPQGSKYALELPRGGNRYFSASSYVEYGAPDRFKVGSDTKVEFDYYLEEGSVLRVQMYCPPRRDNFYFDVKNPTIGQWDKFTLDFSSFADNAHTGGNPRQGDIISNLQIYGGYAGEDTILVIDNVKIINTH
jgi:hypothetical protein